MTSLHEKRDFDTKGTPQSDDLEDIVRNTIIAGEISEYAVVAEGEERTTWFIWVLVCCCSISGLLFGECFCRSLQAPRLIFGCPPTQGYDTGVISGALVTIGSDLGPTNLSSGQKVLSYLYI